MIALLTAVTPHLEAGVATRVEALREVRLVRRCADIPDLLSAAAAHLAQAAVVSADLPGMSRSVIGSLVAEGIQVVGVHAVGDEEGQRRLRQLGVDRVIPASASPQEWEGLATSLGEPRDPAGTLQVAPLPTMPTEADLDSAIARELLGSPQDEDPTGDLLAVRPQDLDPPDVGGSDTPGRVVAVWGPVGSPGRTTVAVNLAAELGRIGKTVLLIDADTYGASIAQVLALLDEAPGLAAATRLADTGDLDQPALAQVAPIAVPGVRVLTGLPRADRWSEVGEEAFDEVLRQGRILVDFIVVDTGFCLEEDEELSYDTRAPRRNITTLATLRAADDVLVVGAGDPVGLQRLVRGLDELSRVVAPSRVIINKVRASAVGSGPHKRVVETLERFAGIVDPVVIPDDRQTLDAAMLAGQVLAEAAAGSRTRRALTELAGSVAGVEVVPRRRSLLGGAGGRRSTA